MMMNNMNYLFKLTNNNVNIFKYYYFARKVLYTFCQF